MARRIALTGGIGSGKSTVAKMFANLGIPTLDLDSVGKTLLQDKQVQSDLVQAFGKAIVEQKTIARHKLATIAFANTANTKRLNDILHPRIRAYEEQWLQRQSHHHYVVIEASALIESGDAARMDALLVVMADLKLREARVLARGRQDKVMFESIVQRQCDDDTRLQMADYVIDNNGDMKKLTLQVQALSKQLEVF